MESASLIGPKSLTEILVGANGTTCTFGAFRAPFTLLRMRTNRTQGTWCTLPDGLTILLPHSGHFAGGPWEKADGPAEAPPLRGAAFEDAAGCPACLSLSLPRGDGVKKK